jgi:hypothetical protein
LGASINGDVVTVTDVRFDTDGTYTVVGKVHDWANNESAASSELTFTIDRTPPAKPTVVVHGAISATPTFRVSGVEAGALVIIYSKASNGDLTEIGRGTATGTSIDIAATSRLSTGANTVVVKATDAAGNESAPSNDLPVTISSSVSLGFRSGTPEGYAYSKPKFVVEADEGDRVAIYKGETRVSAEKTVGASGKVIFDFSELSVGGGVAKNDAIEARGSESRDASTSLTLSDLDTTAPQAVTSNPLSATVNNNYFTLTFDEALGYVDGSKFTVTGEVVRFIRLDPSDATKVYFTLNNPVLAQAYTVSWTKGAVVDRAGNDVAAKSKALSVTATVDSSDTTGPVLAPYGFLPATKSSSGGNLTEDYYPIFVFQSNVIQFYIRFVENLKDNAETVSRLTIGSSDSNFQVYKLGPGGSETLVLTTGSSSSPYIGGPEVYLYFGSGSSFPSDPFVAGQTYRLKIKAGAVEDVKGNANLAISYDFTYAASENIVERGRGVNMSLLSTGDKGLTIVDLKTLRVNFEYAVKLGYYGDAITIEKKDAVGVGYTEVSGDFELSTSGKGLIIALDSALDSGSAYRVKLAPHAVKRDGETVTSPVSLTTETEKVDLVSPTLDTSTSGGLVVGTKLIQVYFSEKMRVNDVSKIVVKDGSGGSVSVSSADVTGNFVNVRLTNPTESSKKYKVEFSEGGVSDDAPYRNDGLSFVGSTVLESPVSGAGPKVTRIDVPNVNNATVTITFDKDIKILDSKTFKASTYRASGNLEDDTPSNVRVDGKTIKFGIDVFSTFFKNTLKISFDEGFVGLASDGEVWNESFSEISIPFTGAAGTWTPTGSFEEDEGGDLLGLGVASDADYGF